MDVENRLFLKYKEYIMRNSLYMNNGNVYNDTPQQLSEFPTILFLEDNSSNGNKSTEYSEYIDNLQYRIEIYSKNITLNGKLVPRKIITNEIKHLTFEFLNNYGLDRESCTKGEYLDLNVDRTIIIATCSINSWDGKII